LDSKEPTASFTEFIKTENRYSSLTRKFPERAARLFEEAEAGAKQKYQRLLKLVDYYSV
jgi:pyruvate-ferredoxin/flavodoxin oxidoreductase